MNWYERNVLPWLIHWVMRESRLVPYRARVAGGAQGRVLEVGVGSGNNLRHYGPAVEQVVGIDPSERLLAFARRAAARGPSPPLELHALAVEHLPFPDASFDSVVMTWTLCSVADAPAALAEMRRVLKPGGRLHFVEHGRSPEPGVRAWQERLTPFWRRIAGGCHLDRPMDALIATHGFRLEHLETGYAPGPRFVAYLYEGAAAPA